jgi:CIC family chloride channel protein
MMLAIGIAYVALRRETLYPAQLPGRVRRGGAEGTALADVAARPARALLVPPEVEPLEERAPLAAILAAAAGARAQRVVALAGPSGLAGLVELATVAEVPEAERGWMRGQDARVPFVSVDEDASWGDVAALLERCGVSQVPVVRGGEVVGWIGDRELRRAVLGERAGAGAGGG